MRVLVFSNLFPSSREPTRGVFALQRLQALADHCEVRVVCPVSWRDRIKIPRELFWGSREEHGSLRVDYPTFIPIVRASARLNPWLMYRMTRRTVRRIHADFRFDAILAAWGYPDAAAALRLSRDFDCAQVTQLLGSDINQLGENPTIRQQLARTLAASERILVMSRAMMEAAQALGAPRQAIHVQHNGVDQDRFRLTDRNALRKQLGILTRGKVILFVGNLVTVKAPDILIEAFIQLHLTGDVGATLVVVGDGPWMPRLVRMLSSNGILEKVRFVGRRSHSEIPSWIGAADLLCLPSHAEGCPNVVLEAMASGRPVVASDVGAIPDLITADNGKTVPPGDALALAEALQQALNKDWSPDAIRASISELTWDTVGRNYRDVLVEAVKLHRKK